MKPLQFVSALHSSAAHIDLILSRGRLNQDLRCQFTATLQQ